MSKARAIVGFPGGRRGKWVVLVLWIVILAVAGSLAGKLTGAEKNDTQSWLPQQAQSTKVLALQSRFQSPNVYSAVVVYDRPSGLTAADRAKAASDAAKFTTVPGVVRGEVLGPFVARDGTAIQTVVPVNLGKNGWNAAGTAADAIRGVAQANAHGLAVHIAGPLGTAADSAKAFKGINGTLLYATLAIVIVLLLITYRSPVLWLLPVISSAVALTSSQALIYLLAAHAGLTVNAQSAGILDVLVFGAGTDYALLLTARYREELRRHSDRHEAMAVALRRAGPAVVASAGTVIVSLLALLIAELNSTKGLGPVLAIGVAVALLAMMTLLPALLVIVGRWVFWPARPAYGSAEPTSRGVWARIGRGIAARPRVVWVATAVVLGAMALGLTGLKASGLTNAQSFRGHSDSVTGQTILDQHFAGGSGQPVVVVGNQAAAARLESAVPDYSGGHRRDRPGDPGQPRLPGGDADHSARQPGGVHHDRPGPRPGWPRFPAPTPWSAATPRSTSTSQQAAAHDRNVIIPVVLAVVFVILALLLRAVIAPLMLIATVVLSFALGAGGQRAVLQQRVPLRRRGHLVPAVRVRVPGRPGHRLQHLPDDPGTGGSRAPRHPPRRAHRACGHRRGDHLGRGGAGSNLRGPGHPARHLPHRARVRGRVRRAAGHHRGPVGAGHRAQPGPRPRLWWPSRLARDSAHEGHAAIVSPTIAAR